MSNDPMAEALKMMKGPIDVRVTRNSITFKTASKTRKKPQAAGDVKVVKGVRFVRRHARMDGCHVVSNGRPVFEWVREP